MCAIIVLTLLHQTDHVLRVDHSDWPFTDQFSPLTISLIVYPMAVFMLFQRSRPWLRVGLIGFLYLATQITQLIREARQHNRVRT